MSFQNLTLFSERFSIFIDFQYIIVISLVYIGVNQAKGVEYCIEKYNA